MTAERGPVDAGVDGRGFDAGALARQTALARLGAIALGADTADALLGPACGLVADAVGAVRVRVLEPQPGGGLRTRRAAGSEPGTEGAASASDPATPLASALAEALRATGPVALDAAGGPRDEPAESRLVAVAIAGGDGPDRAVHGLLEVDRGPRPGFEPQDVSFLADVASLLGTALERIGERARSRRRASFLAEILDASPDCMTVMRPDGSIEFMNGRGLALNELAHPHDAVGRNIVNLWPESEGARLRQALAHAAAGETVRFDGYCPGASGEPRWLEVILSPMPPEDDVPGGDRPVRLLGVSRDITDRMRDDAARLEDGRQLGAALALGRLGRFDWTLRTGAIRLDARTREIFGFDPHETLAIRDLIERIHPDDLERLQTEMRRSARTKARLEIGCRMVRRDGEVRSIVSHSEPVLGEAGRIVRVAGVFRDVTDRRRIEDRLRQLNDRLRQRVAERTSERDRIWNSTSDLMGTAGLDGYLREVNPAWSRTLGWTEAELRARPFVHLIDPADHEVNDDVMRRLSQGETVTGFIEHVIQKDGTQRTVMWDAVPDGDEVFQIVGRDISDLRRVEAQLRQSQKMEAVGQLTGGLAHDFNNMLTGITGSLELLSSRVARQRFGELDRYIDAAQHAASRAAALTHRLLAFSRQQTLDPRPTDVNLLVSGMEELIRRTTGPAIGFEFVADRTLWPALVDSNQLENALLNLCINARDAMPDGGHLRIGTANRALDAGQLRGMEIAPGDYLTLTVTDDGVGMSREVIARAFDPFFTTKPLGEGTGLGLSMIYGFARQSGGQVRIVSEPGQGTTVSLYLPRHHGEAVREPGPGAGSIEHDSTGGGRSVLVVDDEATIRMLVTDVLGELGYVAIEAADGAAGLSILRSEARVDLLVSDVGLPGGMNGRQMVDLARVARPDLKVLFITGYAENAVIGRERLGPGMAVMTKPFSLEALAVRIREMITDAA